MPCEEREMILCHKVQGFRGSLCVFVLAAACFAAIPRQALAAQVEAYAIFELNPSTSVSAAEEKLRSTSLSNCLQLIIGSKVRDVVVHIACSEFGTDTNYLSQALMALSNVAGVSRATIVFLRRDAN